MREKVGLFCDQYHFRDDDIINYYTSSKFLLYITVEFGGKYFDQSPVAIHDG